VAWCGGEKKKNPTPPRTPPPPPPPPTPPPPPPLPKKDAEHFETWRTCSGRIPVFLLQRREAAAIFECRRFIQRLFRLAGERCRQARAGVYARPDQAHTNMSFNFRRLDLFDDARRPLVVRGEKRHYLPSESRSSRIRAREALSGQIRASSPTNRPDFQHHVEQRRLKHYEA